MSATFEKLLTRSNESINQNELSFRTLKVGGHYNLNDFLPPSQPTQSRTMFMNMKTREKNVTEPNDRQPKGHEFNQLKRRVALLEQQRMQFKNYLQKANSIIKQKDDVIDNLNLQIKEGERESEQLKRQMEVKPKLSLARNCVHFQLYPKFKQTYQVTVQTDPIIETVISNTLSSVKNETHNKVSSDKQMQNIYDKLQSLKMGKRQPKAEPIRPVSQLISNPKTDRPRVTTLSNVWGNWQEKENMMRLSNQPEFYTKYNENTFQTNKQRVRQESIDIYAIEEDKLQRILNAYFD